MHNVQIIDCFMLKKKSFDIYFLIYFFRISPVIRVYNPRDQTLYTSTYLRKNKHGQKSNIESLTNWLVKLYKFKKNMGQKIDNGDDINWEIDGPEIGFILLEGVFCIGLLISNVTRKNLTIPDIERGFPQLMETFIEKNPNFFNKSRFEEVNELNSDSVSRKLNLG